jgi:hypothetical protein
VAAQLAASQEGLSSMSNVMHTYLMVHIWEQFMTPRRISKLHSLRSNSYTCSELTSIPVIGAKLQRV